MICFTCSNCGQAVRTSDKAAGKSGRCPFCKTIQAIPHPFELALAEGSPPEAAALAEGSVAAAEVAMPNSPEDMPAVEAPAALPKKMYRQYTAADAGPQRKVSINLGKRP